MAHETEPQRDVDVVQQRQPSRSGSDQGEPLKETTSAVDSALVERQVETTFNTPRKRRSGVVWVTLSYILLIAIPWAATCLLNYRPIYAPSYVDQTGRLDADVFKINERVLVVVDVAVTVAAVLTIPAISFIIAQAAVVWLQRDEKRRKGTVSLSHLLDLADKGWTEIGTVWGEIYRKRSKHEASGRNWFLLGATAFTIFSAVILPLRQALVRTENVPVVTCDDVPYYPNLTLTPCSSNYITIARDQQPVTMQQLPLWTAKELVTRHVVGDTGNEPQAFLWTNTSRSQNDDTWTYSTLSSDTSSESDQYLILPLVDDAESQTRAGYLVPWWVAGVPNGTTTGVLRQHAMRLNSSVECETIDISKVPRPCPGAQPFTSEYAWDSPTLPNHGQNRSDYEIRVCLPGNFTEPLWNRMRDAVTISEEIYLSIDYLDPNNNTGLGSVYGGSWGTHCTVKTTRGFFELGNAFNDFVPQDLLQSFPSVSSLEDFNDFIQLEDSVEQVNTSGSSGSNYVSEIPPDYWHQQTQLSPDSLYGFGAFFKCPGPLAVAAVAIFGNESFFGRASRAARGEPQPAAIAALCSERQVPFETLLQFDRGGYSCDNVVEAVESPDDPELGPDWVAQDLLNDAVVRWFENFSIKEELRIGQGGPAKAFALGVFYASMSLLNLGLDFGFSQDGDGRRAIYSSDGSTTSKPSISFPVLIVLNSLFVLEIIGILLLTAYATHTPIWTRALKALNIAQLANGMDKGILPPAGACEDSAMRVLREMDGRVGVQVSGGADSGDPTVQRLVFGGPEAVTAFRLRRRRYSA